MSKRSNTSERLRYQKRLAWSLIATLAGAIALVNLWPVTEPGAGPEMYVDGGDQELIQFEEIQQTRQEQQAPPPPMPMPIEVPDDIVLEDDDLDFTDIFDPVDEPGEDEVAAEGTDDPVEGSPGASRGARLLRLSEPAVPQEARRQDISARVELEVVVNNRGEVEEATISARYLIRADGSEERVAELGYGLEEAALDAARRLLYRPAMQDGEEVAERTTVSLTIGGNS